MSRLVFTNNAVGELAQNIAATDTALTLQTGQAQRFPVPGAGEHAVIVVQSGGIWEIMHVTANAGDVLTVVRGQEGTIPQNFPTNSVVEQRVTAGVLARISAMDALEDAVAMASWVGEVRMHSGPVASIANIPGGVWKLCDGLEGRPDLRNRFIIGAGSIHQPGAIGGAVQWVGKVVTRALAGMRAVGHVLTGGQMPVHNHPAWTDEQGEHQHAYERSALVEGPVLAGSNQGYNLSVTGAGTGFAGRHGHNVGVGNAGNNEPHDHGLPDLSHDHDVTVPTLPPYYAMCFVIRVA